MKRDVPRSSAVLIPPAGCAISCWAMRDGRYFSTTTGNTETAAGYIAAETGLDAVRSCSARTVEGEWLVSAPAGIRGLCSQVDIGDVSGDDIMACDSLIIGAPTWHTGADSERSGTVPRGLGATWGSLAFPYVIGWARWRTDRRNHVVASGKCLQVSASRYRSRSECLV